MGQSSFSAVGASRAEGVAVSVEVTPLRPCVEGRASVLSLCVRAGGPGRLTHLRIKGQFVDTVSDRIGLDVGPAASRAMLVQVVAHRAGCHLLDVEVAGQFEGGAAVLKGTLVLDVAEAGGPVSPADVRPMTIDLQPDATDAGWTAAVTTDAAPGTHRVLSPGVLLDSRYELLEPAGPAARAPATWLARDAVSGSRVILHGLVAAEPIGVSPQRVPARHRNVVGVWPESSERWGPYWVEEVAVGRTLGEWLVAPAGRAADVEGMVTVWKQIAAALDACHTRRPAVVHGRLRSEDIRVDDDGVVRVGGWVNFGDEPAALSTNVADDVRALADLLRTTLVVFAGRGGGVEAAVGRVRARLADGAPLPATAGALADDMAKVLRNEPVPVNPFMGLLGALGGERAPAALPLIESADQAVAWRDEWARRHSADLVFTNEFGMRFRLIPPGRFRLGTDDPAAPDEGPATVVEIAAAFYAAEVPLTNEQLCRLESDAKGRFVSAAAWAARDCAGGRRRPESAATPATCLSADDATKLAAALERADGRRYRLPTEAMWEYAARAGVGRPYWWPQSADGSGMAVFAAAAPAACDERRANPWGLVDVLGNVGEWTASDYRPYRDGAYAAVATGAGGGGRVVRGGSYRDGSISGVRVSRRRSARSGSRIDDVGVRLVCEVEGT